jgi:hypothetical protein
VSRRWTLIRIAIVCLALSAGMAQLANATTVTFFDLTAGSGSTSYLYTQAVDGKDYTMSVTASNSFSSTGSVIKWMGVSTTLEGVLDGFFLDGVVDSDHGFPTTGSANALYDQDGKRVGVESLTFTISDPNMRMASCDIYAMIYAPGLGGAIYGVPTTVSFDTAALNTDGAVASWNAVYSALNSSDGVYYSYNSAGSIISHYDPATKLWSYTLTAGDDGVGVSFRDITFSDELTADATVPEPATFGLVGLGVAGIGALRRRRTCAN